MEHGDYPLRLQDHLTEHGFRPESIERLGQICRRSLMSEQSVLEVLETVEADRRATDEEMRAAGETALRPDTAWDGDMLAARRATRNHRVDL